MSAARDEGKKRAPEGEAEAEVHQAFRRSANALSQLYAASVADQKSSFLAGERRSMVRQLSPPLSPVLARLMIGWLVAALCGGSCRVLGPSSGQWRTNHAGIRG